MTTMTDTRQSFSALEKQLLDNFQHGFPLSESPFLEIANAIGSDEETVLRTYQKLHQQGFISRIGPVFKSNSVGVSTLCAMALADDDVERVANLINDYREVNHNYQRSHRYNLWFVVTAANKSHLDEVLHDIQQRSGYTLLNLPMEQDFHIDLGFKIQWT